MKSGRFNNGTLRQANRSGSAAKLDDGQMLPAFDVAHREPDLVAIGLAATWAVWPIGSRLQPSSSHLAARVDFARCLPGQSHVRPFRVVPGRIQRKFTPHRCERRWNEKAPRALLLHRSDEPFDDGNARGLTDRSVARSDAPAQ